MRLALLVCLAAVAYAAAPEKELVRDEPFNFRVVGELPRGWERRPHTTVWSFGIDGIPHAYVHLVRERLRGNLDVEAQVQKRAKHYRFPGKLEDVKETVGRTEWGGRSAVLFEYSARVRGVLSRRRVTALYVASFWYELIETIYGEETETIDRCRRGLRVFREGFGLLVEPISAEDLEDIGRKTIESEHLGYRIVKPEGFKRIAIDTGQDPGCRVAFGARKGDPHKTVRVRLFEFGVRQTFDPEVWFDVFFGSFATINAPAKRDKTDALKLKGAAHVWAEIFRGNRDEREVRTLLMLAQTASKRIFAIRIRSADGAHEDFKDELRAVLESVEIR